MSQFPTLSDVDVSKVHFTIPGRNLVRTGMSVVKITNSKNVVEFTKNGSLHDTRMGAFRNVKCGTCNKNSFDCSGHFGHIDLTYPVLNSVYIKTNLKSILANTCFRCYKVKRCICQKEITVEQPAAKRRKTRSAEHAPLPTIKKLKPLQIKMVQSVPYTFKTAGVKHAFFLMDEETTPVSLLQLYEHFTKVPEEEYRKIFPEALQGGVDMTDYVFIHALPVIPTASRPPNISDGNWRPDPISRLYLDILKASDNIRMKKDQVFQELMIEYHNRLQCAVNLLFDINDTSKNLKQMVAQNGGFRQRIDGKEGRVRQNLMGKRVEFSARTVLSGDPRLGINEVGVPAQVAENLTIPEMLTYHNLHVVPRWNIRYVYKKGEDQRYDVKVNPKCLNRLTVGDKVERSLINGDLVIVNRQPTLHRGSMIACYVRIFHSKTFRLNYSTMVTLNADTDGDEINLHVPQDLASRAELEELMLASTNIVCSQGSKPLVGCTQDSLLGCYQLSKATLPWRDFMAIMYELHIEDIEIERRDHRGVEVMDAVLAHLGIDIDLLMIPKAGFVMRDSKVISGVFDKSVVGSADNSVIHHIFLSYDHNMAAKFIHLMQTAATAFLDMDGFSVGIGDCVVNHEPLHDKELEKMIQKEQAEGKAPDEELLAEATGSVIRLEAPHHSNPDNNNLLTMIQSGAKGSMVNYNQITRAVGQQTVGANRVPSEFGHSGPGRTLPHFKEGDRGLYAGGFVRNSYVKGLTPHEFFFHSMGGRIGMIDTSCKTADTGAQQRRLVKVLENAVIKEDGHGGRMVVNGSTGQIIQFNFGEDNFDGTYLKKKAHN